MGKAVEAEQPPQTPEVLLAACSVSLGEVKPEQEERAPTLERPLPWRAYAVLTDTCFRAAVGWVQGLLGRESTVEEVRLPAAGQGILPKGLKAKWEDLSPRPCDT